MMRIGILGGGLSAVTLNRFLKPESEILEKEDRLGGLCRSFCTQGFHYDVGGHILFSKDAALMEAVKEVLAGNLNYCRRNNQILFKDRYVKYPFENALGALDKEDVYDCLITYLKNENPKPRNFKEWIYYTFGNGIANNYLVPYNSKIWKEPLENMELGWVERVPRPPLEDVVKSAVGIETEGYLHQLHFLYPATGGIEALVTAMCRPDAQVITNYEIKKLKKSGRKWLVSDGTIEREYDEVVSTIPLPELVSCLEGIPAKITQAVSQLRYNQVRVVLVGVNHEGLMDKSAVYVPQADAVFHRLCYMGYFSRANVPAGKSSIIAEMTTWNRHALYQVPDEALVERVIADLERLGFLHKNEVVATEIRNFPYGYVVYDLDYQRLVGCLRDYLQSLGIQLLGRFGEFEYINMDEVIRRGKRLAEQLNERFAANNG
ncbi:FAD-dependent oxidoreductase [candidate division FCPU426 bacterium]|nr:FAD-dependent oxidoreductase [candidate division FCPU426 bacterium]